MKKLMSAAVASVAIGVFASAAHATPVTYIDTYYGGDDGSYNSDVVGDVNKFNIFSMDVERVLNNLVVNIKTNYAGSNIGSFGTRLGSLFIGDPKKLNYNGADTSAKHNDDVFTGDKDRYSYVFDFDKKYSADKTGDNPNKPGSGTGSLYKLKGDGSDIVLTQDLIDPHYGFRHNQAVDIKAKSKTKSSDTGIDGTWSTGAGLISFMITDFFSGKLPALYNTSLTLAWAMTCSNDIILAQVTLPKKNVPEVPVPAGIVLLLSGLGGMGAIGRLRTKKAKSTK
jgi:hypothetical protein